MVDTIYIVYTIQTALHCFNSSICAYIHISLEKVKMLLEWADETLSKKCSGLGEWAELDIP